MVEMLGDPANASNHRVRFVLHAPSLDYPIAVPFAPADQMSGERIMNEIQRVLNSNQNFDIGTGIHINFLTVSIPAMGTSSTAGGLKHRKIIGLNEWAKNKSSIITIRVGGNNCLMAAIAIGRALICDKKLGYHRETLQKKLMYELAFELDSAGVLTRINTDCQATSGSGKLTVNDLDHIGAYMPTYCIAMYDANCEGDVVHIVNPNAENHIDLLYDDGAHHVDVITSMKAIFQVNFYCCKCHSGHRTRSHLCPASCCVLCYHPECLNTLLYTNEEPTRCPTCHLRLKTTQCIDSHIGAICATYSYCIDCGITYKKEYGCSHVCGYTRCKTCQVQYPTNTHNNAVHPAQTPSKHECFIVIPPLGGCKTRKRCRPNDVDAVQDNDASLYDTYQGSLASEDADDDVTGDSTGSTRARGIKDSNIFAFDIETDQSDDGNHRPNLLVMEPLAPANAEPTFFSGYNCIDAFCREILVDKHNAKIKQLFFAHFGSGFDFLPILRWLYDNKKFLPKLIISGNKILSMTVGHKRFLDSFLFIPIPISAFSKTFDIKEHKKGHFPHLLSTPSNQSLIGESGWFPEKELFGITRMNFKSVEEFSKWHEHQSCLYARDRLQYSFAKELRGYCLSDVRVLKHGILTFRALIQKLTGSTRST
jgi:hypothetical protein